MEDRLLVGALRSRDPAAIGAVYDAYADRLHDYCWFRLRNRDGAQVALRDTMMCADARIGELRDPARLVPWLYAIARIECRRRSLPDAVEPDISIARHDQDDVDLRLIAWRAVTCLPPLSQELLDLRHRRDLTVPDIASVVGLPPNDVDDLIGQAGARLRATIGTEILAGEEPFECGERTAILRHRRGELDDDLRDSLAVHAAGCGACARHLPRNVSAAKVYALLPCVLPSAATRLVVTGCFTDPELARYRMLAAARMPRFGAHGFPEQAGAGRAATPSRRPRALAALAALAGALVTAWAAAHVARWPADHPASSRVIGIGPAVPTFRLPSPAPLTPPAAGHPVAAEPRPRAPAPSPPSVALRGAAPALATLPGAGWLAVDPAGLILASGAVGTATIRAVGGPVTWRAFGTGPVTVDPAAGVLGAGGSEAVTVRAPGGGPGRASVVFEPGDARAAVAWGRPGTPPVTTPPTTPSPSDPPPSSPPSSVSPSPAWGRPSPHPVSVPAPASSTPARRMPSPSAWLASAAGPEASSQATIARRRPQMPESPPASAPEPAAS